MTEPARIGRYEVVRLLGEGGMGRVFLARDPVLGREVAVKVLRDDLGLPPEVKTQLLERMRHEARAAATVRHPNLVTLHDMGESSDVGLYLVFEYVQGPTLRERVATGPVPPLEVARMAVELGAALTTAHEAGILHRDVKPDNVICSSTGAVVTDFGLARLPDSHLTTLGTRLGTIGYAAPETLTSTTGGFSPASDQFSLAATFYEALTGRRAFPGDDVLAVASSIASGEPAPMVPPSPESASGTQTSSFDYRERLMLTRAEGVLRRALQKDPAKRYPSCRAFGDALGSAIDVRISSGFPTISLHSSIVPRATRRWQNVAIGAALALIVGLLLWGRPSDRAPAGASPLRSAASEFSASVREPPPRRPRPRHRARPAASLPSAEPHGSASAAPETHEDASAR